MKNQLRKAIDAALARLQARDSLAREFSVEYQIETPKAASHGDYSTNVAMLLAKPCRRPPRELAAEIVEELKASDLIEQVDIAGPGFINFTLADRHLYGVVDEILDAGARYGRHTIGAGQRVQVEFVSANPTGPLHVGHGRGAAIGSVIAALLECCGYEVCREYYVNDAGRQMDILAMSVYLRFLQAHAIATPFPAQAYQGGYIMDIAAAFASGHDRAWCVPCPELEAALAGDDPERSLDAAIAIVSNALGRSRYLELREFAKEIILDGIRDDLAAFGVRFDSWYSEMSLETRGLVTSAIESLEAGGHLYRENGARWFRSAALGDEKDRVVVRENGQTTYFASDIAYHLDKFARGFTGVIDVWGADHHGYVPRVKAALSAAGADAAALDVVLVQFAALVRGGEKVAMSTRSGEFVTLRELVDEVGVDAARFFYVMRRADQHLEFDLDLATAESSDNPVYYVQYAHARIASVFRQLDERGFEAPDSACELAGTLTSAVERALAMRLSQFPDIILNAALAREPHALTQYLRDLAHEFHGYYNGHKILVDDAPMRGARVRLISATRQVLANGLAILGIRAPDEM